MVDNRVLRQYEDSPKVLTLKQRADVISKILGKRLETILPSAMEETGFDMWLIICQEDDLDPVFRTLVPMDTWFPILQILVFSYLRSSKRVECMNISGTNMGNLYYWPYKGQIPEEQWSLLVQIISERNPNRIGINIGSVQWAAGGLTCNLYKKLLEVLPAEFRERLESAENLVTKYSSTLVDNEIELYEHVVDVAHSLIRECYSRRAIVPGVTTTRDLEWYYWQLCADLGLEVSFKPFFNIVRSQEARDRCGDEDQVIRPGDLVHSDVGIRYLRLNTDHQEWAYILKRGENDVPEGMKKLMADANRLQNIFMSEFKLGLSGNELLNSILTRAHNEGIPNPRVFSHSLGLFLHEPGPLIGLPWEQKKCNGRGEVKLEYDSAFAMELSVSDHIREWNHQEVKLGLEEDVIFTRDGCHPINDRQTEFHVI